MKNVYDEDYLLRKYENKKRYTEETRLIPFKFSEQEWLDFHKVLYSGVTCAYSNQEFIFRDHHSQSPSIERIDDNLPYEVSNCVWVNHLSNGIKDHLSRGGNPESLSTQMEVGLARRIKRIIDSQEALKEIRKPYEHLYNNLSQESDTLMTKSNNKTHTNTEIDVANQYAEFGSFVETQCEAVFSLTYTEFKRIVQRKTCGLTGRAMATPTLFVVDKSIPVSKSNVVVCDKTLQEALDTMIVSAKLSTKDLKKLCKMLVK